MLKAIIIDDEINALDSLEIELNAYCPDVELVAKCDSATKGIAAIKEHNPDIVFLDIEMPWMNGFEMLEQFQHIDFDVVFVTAYDQFAVRAFDFSAVDYLLKPVSKEKLIRAVDKSLARMDRSIPHQQFDLLKQYINTQTPGLPCIALPTPEGLEFVNVADIIYCESDSNYTHVHLSNGEQIFLSKTLKYLQELLREHPFFRIHQSYLVNLSHVKKYVKGEGGYVVMMNGKSLTVSRANKKALMELVRL